MGHAMNKTLKDIINKYQLLRGRKVCYVPGWDCHGLPIELKVLQEMKPEERQQLTPLTLRRRAKEWGLATGWNSSVRASCTTGFGVTGKIPY